MRPIGASLSRYYYSRMGKGCQHLRHINFQTVATLPTLGTPPGFTNCIPHRHCNHCDQQPTAARRTTVGQQRGNPIHPSSRGGRVDAVVTVPAVPAALPMLTVLAPALPPSPRLDATPPPPPPLSLTFTPTPPPRRAGHAIPRGSAEDNRRGLH